MSFSKEQMAELKTLCPAAALCLEGDKTLFLLPSLALPNGCVPGEVDGLLWPYELDGYPSRLFLSAQVSKLGEPRNWNTNRRILDRNWFAFSWHLHRSDLRLAQMLAEHLRGLR